MRVRCGQLLGNTIAHIHMRTGRCVAGNGFDWPHRMAPSILRLVDISNHTSATPPPASTTPPTTTPTPTPTPIETDITPNCALCTTGCSSCPITYACGVHSGSPINASDHEWVYENCSSGHAHYECDGTDHSLQASCSVTNSRGDTCTVSSFYACASHTHQYPARCARNACAQIVSTRLAHRIDCSNCGGYYWTCISGATHNHTTVFTCKRPGCGVSFTSCSNGSCTSN